MPVTFEEIREIALGFPGVEERPAHGGRTCFRTGKRMIAWGYPDDGVIVLYIPFEAREMLIADQPAVFSAGQSDYPSARVNLETAEPALIAELLEDAWRLAATKQQIAEWEASR